MILSFVSFSSPVPLFPFSRHSFILFYFLTNFCQHFLYSYILSLDAFIIAFFIFIPEYFVASLFFYSNVSSGFNVLSLSCSLLPFMRFVDVEDHSPQRPLFMPHSNSCAYTKTFSILVSDSSCRSPARLTCFSWLYFALWVLNSLCNISSFFQIFSRMVTMT